QLAPVALGPQQICAALQHRDDVLVTDVRLDPLFLPPDARPVRPGGAQVTLVEQLDPGGGAARLERLHVVHHLEEVSAFRTLVDDLVEGVLAVAAVDAAEGGARHREEHTINLSPEMSPKKVFPNARRLGIEIHKFGGASLADAAAFRRVVEIVKTRT